MAPVSHVRLLLAFVLLSGASDAGGCDCTSGPSPRPQPVRNDPPLTGFDFAAALDRHVAGYSYAFSQSGVVVSAGAAGFARLPQDDALTMSSNTRMHIASISKPITATALMSVVETYGVDLDRPFVEWIGGGFASRAPGVDSVTLRHLLTHRSGLAQWSDCGPDLRVSMAQLLATPMAHPAGSTYEYSNGNFCLVRLVIEEVTQRDYVAYVRDRVLLPMGITDMSCAPDRVMYYKKDDLSARGYFWADDYSSSCSAYGWYATASDLALFGDGLRRGKAISTASFGAMLQGRLGLGSFATSNGTAYGHNGGWVTGDDRGYRGELVLFPNELTAVVLINTWGIDPHTLLMDGFERWLQ